LRWPPFTPIGRAKPKPGLVFDEAFADHRQPAQRLLESRRLAHTPPLTVEDHPTSGRGQFHPPDGVKEGSLPLQESQFAGPGARGAIGRSTESCNRYAWMSSR